MAAAKQLAERLVYRVAGLPVAARALLGREGSKPTAVLRAAFARCYWHPKSAAEAIELCVAMLLSPVAVLMATGWFTLRNGSIVRQRYGKGIVRQFADQLKLYVSDGIFGPWYYVFSLHEDGAVRAPTFIQRFETKTCYFRLLKAKNGSPLQDKLRFASFCSERGIRAVETLACLDGCQETQTLPRRDLFVKPVHGRGGRGAERWDHVACECFAGPGGERLCAEALRSRLVERSGSAPLIIQPRLVPHADLAAITTGALPTVRVLTALDEQCEPEVIGAVLRMSVGPNRTVDNLHAGGIGASVALDTGALSKATNLGSDARLGWLSVHPDTGGRIEGRILPAWREVQVAAVEAHRHFNDRVVVGWDIAILDDGPIIIEGNGNPDLDILQRFMRMGFGTDRLGELLAFHIARLSSST